MLAENVLHQINLINEWFTEPQKLTNTFHLCIVVKRQDFNFHFVSLICWLTSFRFDCCWKSFERNKRAPLFAIQFVWLFACSSWLGSARFHRSWSALHSAHKHYMCRPYPIESDECCGNLMSIKSMAMVWETANIHQQSLSIAWFIRNKKRYARHKRVVKMIDGLLLLFKCHSM